MTYRPRERKSDCMVEELDENWTWVCVSGDCLLLLLLMMRWLVGSGEQSAVHSTLVTW